MLALLLLASLITTTLERDRFRKEVLKTATLSLSNMKKRATIDPSESNITTVGSRRCCSCCFCEFLSLVWDLLCLPLVVVLLRFDKMVIIIF